MNILFVKFLFIKLLLGCFLENDADKFQVPYEDILPANPSFDQMRDVVCTRKIRPTPSARWQSHPVRFFFNEK